MDDYSFRLWLKETGLWSPSLQPQPIGSPLSDMENTQTAPQPVMENPDPLDLGDDDDADDDDADDFGEDYGGPGAGWENTDLVTAVFRAAGNPRFEDVRLKVARTSRPDPTDRELVLRRAKRVGASPSIEW
jgi:hypothetical protein